MTGWIRPPCGAELIDGESRRVAGLSTSPDIPVSQATALGRAILNEELAGGACHPIPNSAGILDSKPESAASPHLTLGLDPSLEAVKTKLNSRQEEGPGAVTNVLTPTKNGAQVMQMTKLQRNEYYQMNRQERRRWNAQRVQHVADFGTPATVLAPVPNALPKSVGTCTNPHISPHPARGTTNVWFRSGTSVLDFLP